MKKKHRFSVLICIICLFTSSCANQKQTTITTNKTKDISTTMGKYILSAPVIVKDFVKKNGEVTRQKEIYIQRSSQDYYIKFCESKVSREDLDNHLSTMEEIKVATLEVEFIDGSWDICDGNLEQQSRIGEYVIIHRIINDSRR